LNYYPGGFAGGKGFAFCRVLEYNSIFMNQEDLKNRIRAAAPEGKIACAAALRLAKELGLPRKELGELLNELKIKITQCQLGCF
jgi:hypothetical protein